MNTETVVFFYIQEKTLGRKYPWQKVEFDIKRMKWGERRLIAAGIPEYDYNKKMWREELIRKKIVRDLIPMLQIEHFETTNFFINKALYDRKIRNVFEETFPLELIELPEKNSMAKKTPEDIVEALVSELCSYDALVIVDKTGDIDDTIYSELPEFVANHCNRINYLAIITDNQEKYVEVLEEINEEYGLTGMTYDNLKQVKPSSKCKTLVIDAGTESKHIWRYLPPCCTYLDLISSTERQKILEARRKDIHYISFYKQISKMIRQKNPDYKQTL